MDQDFIHRIGTFFILIGIGLILIYIGSWVDSRGNGSYLFSSLIAFTLGFMFYRRKPSRPPSNRFRIFRKQPKNKRTDNQ